MYDGVIDILERLKAQGKRLIVATSKPEVYSKKILEHFDLYKYFDFLAGATFDESRVKKNDVIAHAIKCCELNDLSSVIMVGDREHDVLGAACFGISSIGVLWGYGSREELESAGATYIAEKVEDIFNIVK